MLVKYAVLTGNFTFIFIFELSNVHPNPSLSFLNFQMCTQTHTATAIFFSLYQILLASYGVLLVLEPLPRGYLQINPLSLPTSAYARK